MSQVTCPKCGKNQPVEAKECAQCGIIFDKLLQHQTVKKVAHPIVHKPSEPSSSKNNFLPKIGLKRNLEISILNIFAYIYLILGVGYGIGVMLEVKSDLAFVIGFSIIIASLVTSMLFFVICTVAKKIISMDDNLKRLLKVSQNEK